MKNDTDTKTTDERAKEALKKIKRSPKLRQKVDGVLKKLLTKPKS